MGKLAAALSAKAGSREFRAAVVLDASRGQRGPVSSLTMLKRLVPLDKASQGGLKVVPWVGRGTGQGGVVQMYLFHNPRLRGLLQRLLPDRWNEVLGVQHMKIAVFDDSVLLTGSAPISHALLS